MALAQPQPKLEVIQLVRDLRACAELTLRVRLCAHTVASNEDRPQCRRVDWAVGRAWCGEREKAGGSATEQGT